MNEGVAFSIPFPYPALILVNVLLIFLIIYFSCRELDYDKYLARLSVSLLLAGGVGNLIDRLKNGYVIDFIEIWKWPSFNVADIYISVGVLLIIFFYARIKQVKT